MDLKLYLDRRSSFVEKALKNLLPKKNIPKLLERGMKYSVFSGGKRLRPVLLLASCDSVDGDIKKAKNAACAVELIHTYSLIHDDLPSMDNDDLRRGKPTLHKVIGEGNAILVGDALLTLAFQVIAEDITLEPKIKVLTIYELSRAAGAMGMVGGQVSDIQSEGQKTNLKAVKCIHARKTGALIAASCKIGGLTGGANKKETNALEIYGEKIGLAFQITDDILNVIGDKAKIGKSIGSDAKNKKATYPSSVGIKESRNEAENCVNAAINMAKIFGKKGLPLRMIAEYILNRVS